MHPDFFKYSWFLILCCYIVQTYVSLIFHAFFCVGFFVIFIFASTFYNYAYIRYRPRNNFDCEAFCLVLF